MHTITAIYDSEHYSENYSGWGNKFKSKRLMWLKKREFDAEEK
jgi:hypothetical protein